ncbi:Mariner Mos1 transposase [Eumeta japonica]|uniref:Mariner Mos1 transposase n=1 Tax=Eumeta variegata TaxID=151549 RepID=A0A4C1XS74_EUMVA|nr:Mariner Mos1 transposase [Eumeta japonica]
MRPGARREPAAPASMFIEKLPGAAPAGDPDYVMYRRRRARTYPLKSPWVLFVVMTLSRRSASNPIIVRLVMSKDKDRNGRPKIYEDAELKELLEDDSYQTQKELALTLEVTQQAVSCRFKSLGIIHKQAIQFGVSKSSSKSVLANEAVTTEIHIKQYYKFTARTSRAGLRKYKRSRRRFGDVARFHSSPARVGGRRGAGRGGGAAPLSRSRAPTLKRTRTKNQ